MRTHRRLWLRQITSSALGVGLGLVATASLAHAHGGMAGPDELGPPLFTSAALAFVCYWVVILWPASKKRKNSGGDAPDGRRRSPNQDRRRAIRSQTKAAASQTSQVLKIQTNRGRRARSQAGRKANDA